MKKTFKTLTFSTLVLLAFSTYAEDIIKLENNKPILGKWLMYAETAALHKDKKEVQNEWTFNSNGTISVISRDPRFDAQKLININYAIEDGVIKKQFQPGRSKTEDCKVVKLEAKDMTLHCKFNYYLFKRK